MMISNINRIFVFLLLCFAMTACGDSGKKEPSKADPAADPLIGVTIKSTGETVYDKLNVSGSVAQSLHEPVPSIALENSSSEQVIYTPETENNNTSTLQEVGSGIAALTVYTGAIKTILDNVAKDQYDADFQPSSANITFYGIQRSDQEIAELENILESQAMELGLNNYNVTINLSQEKSHNSVTVWIPGGNWDDPNWHPKYHSRPDCGNMDKEKAQKITLEEAKQRNLEPCSKCF